MHFIHARDALMRKHSWSRMVATLAIRIDRGVDNYETISACVGFTGRPLLTREEYIIIQKHLSGTM